MSNELGQWIERERQKRGWSQRRLAAEANISQAPISRIINKVPGSDKEQICGEKVAQALANAFGANPVYVFRLARILKAPARSRNFATWLGEELALKKMAQEELAEKSGLSNEVVADLLYGNPPTFEIADKLAGALKLETLYVQQLAGLIPPGEDALSEVEIELLKIYRDLDKGARQVVYDLILSLKENVK